jgi:hypothetical protein
MPKASRSVAARSPSRSGDWTWDENVADCCVYPSRARSGAPVHRRAGQRGYGIDGIDNLACITPAIGAGLWRRSGRPGAPPLNVITCENLPGAGAYLRHQVLSALPPERTLTVDSVGGFSAGMTHRIMTGPALARSATF